MSSLSSHGGGQSTADSTSVHAATDPGGDIGRRRLRLMPSLQMWFSVRTEESRLLHWWRAFSSLRLEARYLQNIIRVLAGAGLKEAIDLSLLTDEEIENLTSEKQFQVFVQQAREEAVPGRHAWEQGFSVSRFGAVLTREQRQPHSLQLCGPFASSRGGERAQAAVQFLAMAAAMCGAVQAGAQVPAETLSFAETEQQRLREYFAKAEAFFVE